MKPAIKARQDFSLRRSDVSWVPLGDGTVGWNVELVREGPDGGELKKGVFSGAVDEELFPALLVALMRL